MIDERKIAETSRSTSKARPTNGAMSPIDAAERERILAELVKNDFHVARTASTLNMSRATLDRKIKKYGLNERDAH